MKHRYTKNDNETPTTSIIIKKFNAEIYHFDVYSLNHPSHATNFILYTK